MGIVEIVRRGLQSSAEKDTYWVVGREVQSEWFCAGVIVASFHIPMDRWSRLFRAISRAWGRLRSKFVPRADFMMGGKPAFVVPSMGSRMLLVRRSDKYVLFEADVRKVA
jgi:hypothetical protein